MIAAVTTVILALAFFLDPTQANWLPTCPVHQMTGLYCPGCGSTRALHCLLHGKLALALHFNPLTVTAPLLLGVMAVAPRTTWRPAVGWVVLAIAVLFGILRNIPLEVFQVLRP